MIKRKLKRGRPQKINGQKTGHKYEVHEKGIGILSAWSNMEDARAFAELMKTEGRESEIVIKKIY